MKLSTSWKLRHYCLLVCALVLWPSSSHCLTWSCALRTNLIPLCSSRSLSCVACKSTRIRNLSWRISRNLPRRKLWSTLICWNKRWLQHLWTRSVHLHMQSYPLVKRTKISLQVLAQMNWLSKTRSILHHWLTVSGSAMISRTSLVAKPTSRWKRSWTMLAILITMPIMLATATRPVVCLPMRWSLKSRNPSVEF